VALVLALITWGAAEAPAQEKAVEEKASAVPQDFRK